MSSLDDKGGLSEQGIESAIHAIQALTVLNCSASSGFRRSRPYATICQGFLPREGALFCSLGEGLIPK